MEALHSRGLTTVAKVLEIPQNSFPGALVGTVAFQNGADIYGLAKKLPWDGGNGDSPPRTTFNPVNPGNLVDCIPPCHLSPLGPVQYLFDLLALSDGTQTLRDVLTTRRGDFGSLLVTKANLDLPLPLVDIVNENLEAFGTGFSQATYQGPMFNTLDQGLTDLDIAGIDKLQVPGSLTAVDLLRALPQHSTPHTLPSPDIYDTLKTQVGRPDLPYSQGLDVNRTYLKALGASRFETMRTFQKDITELPQDALKEPDSFQRTLWRFPVRHDIAVEYLCASPEEASTIFGGQMTGSTALQLLGFQNSEALTSSSSIVLVTYFLETTGISNCEFLELHGCGFVVFKPDTYPPTDDFPPCLPCCADSLRIGFDSDSALGEVIKLVIFIRLWRILRRRCFDPLPMKTLADICVVLQLFTDSNVNGAFFAQLASLLMLKELWHLPWTNSKREISNGPPGDQRTELLALWSGVEKTSHRYKWAVEALLDGVERHSMETYHCPKRSASWRKIIAANLDDLAGLAGFDGTAYTWNSKPTCTIRFAEVLSKIYASEFTVGEILFLFTTREHLRGDDPYFITEGDESLDDPLNVPEDDEVHGLWELRRKLLEVDVSENDAREWSWLKIEATLHEMGYVDKHDHHVDLLGSFAEHFFPEILEQEGHPVGPKSRRFEAPIPTGQTSPQIWQQAGDCSPFHFERCGGDQAGVLWAKLPLRNEDVLRALRDLRQLNAAEADALQSVYLEPRAATAPFALVFSNFDRAADYMVQEPCVHKRFHFFQREFARFVRRCRVVAHHIHDAVSAAANIDSAECRCATGEGCECAGVKVAWQILLRLVADENRPAAPWENPDDSGVPPGQFDFEPGLAGGAFAALLGLTGTGLLARYRGSSAGGTAWFEMRGGMSGWGVPNDHWNAPLITVIPRLSLSANAEQSLIVSFKNGFALNENSGHLLSGAEPFCVNWTGVLLIERDGCYHFAMACPHNPDDNGPCHCEKLKQWSVCIQRGQRTWSLLHQGMDEHSAAPSSYSKSVPLRRGAYDITVEFRQPEPDFDDADDVRKFHTGFVLKYTGPDTEDCLVQVPLKSLYVPKKDGCLGSGEGREGSQFQGGLHARYISTLRDIRRTYQRAFKAVLFAHRFCLSACKSSCEWESELSYLLDHADKFQGVSYYMADSVFKAHMADFDFNFLPVTDTYFPPDDTADNRLAPSWKRKAAMFDWFERIFDYTRLRRWAREVCEPPVWLLFRHANSDSPQPVAQLVRFLGIEIALAKLCLEYFQAGGVWDIGDAANIAVLADERWATRVWKAGRYVHRLRQHFYAPTSELVQCRPALWASSPDGNVQVAGTTGNANLMRFVQRCCLEANDASPRLNQVVTLNDGLRLRARRALLAFLDFHGYPSMDLADRLLLDVEADMCETTTRIDDAIAATQRFMQRLVLGLEGQSFEPDGKLLKRWECEFSSFDKWQAAQRRRWYFENWVHWEEQGKLSRCEGFQSLKDSLKADVSTIALPARGQYWQDSQLPPEPAKLQISSDQSFVLASSDQLHSRDEGFRILGTPDHSGAPTWLTAAPMLAETHADDAAGRRDAHELVPNSTETTTAKEAARLLLPGAAALDHIPLWIQAAIRLGTRFVRVAASSLPVGVPYARPGKPYSCCQCKRDHAPAVDEYYFWLEDARRFDPTDAPAPQNADLHITTAGIDAPTDGSGPQIDPRTRDADPTSDWDAPTPQMLSWKSEPLIHLRWTRVHMGRLLDPRRSTEGIPLTDAQVDALFLDILGRGVDSLFFSVLGSGSTAGFRYDVATDSATVLPEAVKSGNPPALPLPASLSSALTAFPYFLYFAPGAPLAPVGTFSTSLVVASSLRADCRFEESSEWLRLAYDPLGRDNTWMQCEERRLEERSSAQKTKGVAFSKDDRNLFAMSLGDGASTNVPPKRAEGGGRPRPDIPCCPTSPVKGAKARGRAAVLEYLETLMEWTDALRCRNSLEASQQALTALGVIGRVLGPKPIRVDATDMTGGQMTLGAFKPYAAPLNLRLMELYDRVDDSLSALRSTLNKRRLRNGELGQDMAHFGSHQRFEVDAMHHFAQPMNCDSLCCSSCCHPYRFMSVLPKAMSWVALAKATAASMLTAIEKADGEALSSLRLAQERQMTELGLEMSKNAYRAADWDVQALDKQMAGAITRLQYFQKLIQNGLNAGELAHVVGVGASMGSRTSATVVDGVGQGMASVPDMWIGIAGVAGSPLQFQQMPMGVKLGTGFAAAARILNTVADISSTSAGLSLTQSGWDRREEEWQHTCDVTVTEIQQIKRQRLASRRRLDNALRELNNTQRRIEHSAEVQDFSRDKASRYELYLYLQQENAALYRQCYEMALRTAQEAQQAVRYELGDTTLNYIPSEVASWDNLHEGLLAGDKLELALYSMERAHMNKNCREYELTKHISLRLHFPAAFVMLKATGYCEVDLPEWFFDLDYPGHYMRRIRSVSLTVPCVAGPYTGVHCKLQQLSSTIRFRPLLSDKDNCKCCPKKKKEKESHIPPGPCLNDPHIWKRYAGTEAIATSAGQNDSGLFELNFSDPRYLPFEYTGAVSRWRIELPPENNQFDFDSLSDLLMHVNFTAREGGPEFARESNALAQSHVPGDGWRFLDVRHEMPEVWNVVRKDVFCEACSGHKDDCTCCDCGQHGKCRCGKEKHHCSCVDTRPKHDEGPKKGWCEKCRTSHHGDERKSRSPHEDECDHERPDSHKKGHHHKPHDQEHKRGKRGPAHAKREFHLNLSRNMFPFLTGRRSVTVTSLHFLLDIKECDPSTVKIRFTPPHRPEEAACVDTEDIPLVQAEGGMLKGSLVLKHPVELEHGPCGPRAKGEGLIGTFSLPCELKGLCGAWLLCGYRSPNKACCKDSGCCEIVPK